MKNRKDFLTTFVGFEVDENKLLLTDLFIVSINYKSDDSFHCPTLNLPKPWSSRGPERCKA